MRPHTIEQRKKLSMGLCPSCGGTNDRFPRFYCSACLKHHNEWAAEYSKRKIKEGICPSCGKAMASTDTGWACNTCKEKHRKALHKHYRHKSDQGLCQDCGKPLEDKGGKFVRCEECRLKRRIKYENNKRKRNDGNS